MQNKGFIRTIAILFAIAALYQLSFSYITYKVRQDAKEYAAMGMEAKEGLTGDEITAMEQATRKKEIYFLDSISNEPVFNLGFKEFTYKECEQRELNLGLDLKGGMNVILEVSMIDIVRSMSNYSADSTFNAAINMAIKMQQSGSNDFVEAFGQSFEKIDPNGKLAAIFATPELKERINFNSTNQDVLKVIKEETKSAIDNSFNVLRNRIDKFGVVQPNIQRLEGGGRILVELPGVKDQDRVRKLLQGTANLEFWETYENQEIYPILVEVDKTIKDIEDLAKASSSVESGEEVVESTPENESVAVEAESEELNLLNQLTSSDSLAASDTNEVVNDQMGQYPFFSVLRPAVFGNELGTSSVIGYAQYKDTSKVNEYMQLEKVKSLFPADFRYYWSVKPSDAFRGAELFEMHAIKVTGRDGKAPLDGDVISNATVSLSQFSNEVTVSMAMNGEGSKIWARLTKDAASQSPQRCIAIVMDNYVYSSPRVNEEITGGSSQISGNFSQEEANDLANVLKSGKLPAPARIIEEQIVGPSLGQEAINSGLNSFAIAFFVVLLYMIFYYSRRAGGIADIALMTNMFFLVGVLASLNAVLTLPGIAGIVLTIGMSVDANVLIYERIREELAAGKAIKQAIADGYKNAYSAIIDANVTTFLTALILFIIGTGPIKGFATTLMYGIITSLFTAIFITRLTFETFLAKGWTLNFSTTLTENAFKNVKIPFIDNRKIFYVISGIIVLVGLGSLFTKGLNPGIDFTGGRTFIVRFHETVSTTEVQNLLTEEFGTMPQVVTYGADNQVKIVTKYRIDENTETVDSEVEGKLYAGLLPLLEEGISKEEFLDEYRQSSLKVGPSIADDIKAKAIEAILLSLLVVFVYILIRFKNWQFGMGAIVALVHDTLIVLGAFSIFYGVLPFSLEIDQAFIAAILTVVGYSINDTVVVFDRIREYINLYPKRERKEIMNMALNDTLSRTFSTSLSTFVVLLSIFLFGGEVIRGFIFALLIGIVVGTYSSVFIATPIVYDTIKKKLNK